MNKKTLNLKVGDTEVLDITVGSEDKIIAFISSDETIAKVTPKQGKVTAVAEGTATITVTTANGKTATCEVTVTPAG